MWNSVHRLVITACIGAVALTGCVGSQSTSLTEAEIPRVTQDIPGTKVTLGVGSLKAIDQQQWHYNPATDVYWQTGLVYVAKPGDESLSSLGIYVPGKFFEGKANPDGTYTVRMNKRATVGAFTAANAPWVMPINAPDYAPMPAPTDYVDDVSTYTNQGMVVMMAGARGRNQGAPKGVSDLKAAIRYIRANGEELPGDEHELYVTGVGAGATLATVLGASGDSDLYTPYLRHIGALDEQSDAVAGVMAWSPAGDMDYANAAYEWFFAPSRTYKDEDTTKLANGLAQAYSTYINDLGLVDADGKPLGIEPSPTGIYQAGSYHNYIKTSIETSLNHFLANTTFPYTVATAQPTPEPASEPVEHATPVVQVETPPQTPDRQLDMAGQTFADAQAYIDALNANGQWVTYDAQHNHAAITSVADFVRRLTRPTRPVAAFDGLEKPQVENVLFSSTQEEHSHFDPTLAALLDGTPHEADFSKDFDLVDDAGNDVFKRLAMYNPMYFINPNYQGFQRAKVAPSWRIRTNLMQGDQALPAQANLVLALAQYSGVNDVDATAVWGHGDMQAEESGTPSEQFITWVKTRQDQ